MCIRDSQLRARQLGHFGVHGGDVSELEWLVRRATGGVGEGYIFGMLCEQHCSSLSILWRTENRGGEVPRQSPLREKCCSTGGANCGVACGADMPSWDTSLVTDMSSLFYYKGSFNQNISKWNVSKVTNMASMFVNVYGLNNIDLSGWNVGAVTDMSRMFYLAGNFNGDLSGWNVGAVTDMSGMFQGATDFNGDLSGWNVGACLLYTSPSPRDATLSRMPSSA